MEASIPCSSVKISILDGQKQPDSCYQSDELPKTGRARKMLKIKISVTYDKKNMTVIAMEKTQ